MGHRTTGWCTRAIAGVLGIGLYLAPVRAQPDAPPGTVAPPLRRDAPAAANAGSRAK